MKSFLILFSIFIVGSVCDNIENDANYKLHMTIFTFFNRLPPPVLRMLVNLFEFKGNNLDQKCPNNSENFTEVLLLTQDCVESTDSSLSVCTGLKTRLITCFEPAINITENCMPENLKGVPTFIAKSTVSLTSYLCGLTGEQLFEFFNNCLDVPTDEKNSIREELQDKVYKLNEVLSVENFCSIGPEIENLIKEYIVKSCLNPMTLTVYAGMMDAFLKPCTIRNQA